MSAQNADWTNVGKWKHRLTDRDFIAKTATCSFCGPVPIILKNSNKVWHCAAGYNTHFDGRNEYRGPYVKLKDRCEICNGGPTVLDHNHSTGDYRGSLCVPCNAALGLMRDDCELLGKAVEYLKRPSYLAKVFWFTP